MQTEVEPFDTERYLSLTPLFSDLSQAERARIALGSELRRIARGGMVFRVGEACEAFHVVVFGQV